MNVNPSSLPIWSYPLILALLGIVLFVGNLSPPLQVVVGVESILYLGYLIFRSVKPALKARAVAKLLPLFPGHLLLLFAISLLPAPPTALVILWAVIPVASVLYDLLASWSMLRERVRMSILVGLYCIIWADLFVLLERVIALGRGLSGSAEIVVAGIFGVVGTVFLFVGAYRHWRVSKL